MKSLTLKLPSRLYDRLCELAKIVDRTPETFALGIMRYEIEEAFEERSVDNILAEFEYRTQDAAIRVARAASLWAARRRALGMYQVSRESGRYTVYELDQRLPV